MARRWSRMFIDDLAAHERVETGLSRPGRMLARKLERHVTLNDDECAALDRLLSRDIRRLHSRTPLAEQGGMPGEIQVMVDGWACRFATPGGGRRRIVAFYLPGDICDFDVFMMDAIDMAIAAIGPVRIAGINRATLNEVSRGHPRISGGLWWESMTAAAIQRAWTINVGRRGATARIANLLCELLTRLEQVGLGDAGSCPLPLTQSDIADACALTAIHTNRAIQELRAAGLITIGEGRLCVHDVDALAVLGEFDGGYLGVPLPRPVAPALVP